MRLDIGWVSQLDRDAPYANDCGHACVLMLLRYHGFVGGEVKVKDLGGGYTSAADLKTLAARYGMPLAWDAGEVDGVPRLLNRGYPVILLVNYLDLGFEDHLASGPDQGLHWLVVVGHKNGRYDVHDPLWPDTRGAFHPIAADTLKKAYWNQRVYHANAVKNFTSFRRGLHGRADAGPMRAADYAAFRDLGAAKLLSNHTAADVVALRQVNPDMLFVVRLFEDFRDRTITPAQFVAKFTEGGDLRRLYDAGVRWVEVHNEPNLADEGLGRSWRDGREFAAWWRAVVAALRVAFPQVLWGFPGLSPQANLWDFLDGAREVVQEADWIGVHQYFRDDAEMDWGLAAIVGEYRRRWPDKAVLVTEFSNPCPETSYAEKGRQIARYWKLAEKAGVAAAFAYLVSSSNDPNREAWVREDGSPTPIVNAAKALPPAEPTHKFGAHLVNTGPRTGLDDFLRALKAAGQPLRAMMSVNDWGVLRAIKEISPGTITLGRAFIRGAVEDTPPGNWSGNVLAVARSWFSANMTYWDGHQDYTDYFVPLNEPVCDSPAKWMFLNELHLELNRLAREEGIKLGLFGFAAGVPSVAQMVLVTDTLRDGYQNGWPLILHEYAFGPHLWDEAYPAGTVLYHRHLQAQVLKPDQVIQGRLKMIMGEQGYNGGHAFESKELFMANVRWRDMKAREDPEVLALCWYTLGDWASANWYTALPEVQAYLLS